MLRASCFMQARRMIEAQVLVHMAPHDDAHDLLARRDGGGYERYDDRARTADSICAPVLDALG
jgi:hypothetical protein